MKLIFSIIVLLVVISCERNSSKPSNVQIVDPCYTCDDESLDTL